MTPIYVEVLEEPMKTGGVTDCCIQQFSREFYTYSKYAIQKVKRNRKFPEKIARMIISLFFCKVRPFNSINAFES